MKSLKKVKIINWHYFWNETMNIEPIVFLTGLNASGKSTLIDAFQVVLLGDTSGRFFNKAASEKSARTLKGYLRGELGDAEDGGFHYLRNGRFTSYIAMEFYDDLKDRSFTLGIVFDSYEDGSEEHRFFSLEDKIPANEFIVNNIPMEYKALSKYFETEYPGQYRFLDSNRQYQELLKKKFGNLKDKYFTLFKKAVSFTPITDITTFITEYVCDAQNNINISSLQENILQYKKLENEASVMEKRIERLEEIELSYQKYLENKKNLALYGYIVDRSQLKADEDKLVSYHSFIEETKKRLLEIDVELADLDHNISELNQKKYRLVQERSGSDSVRITEELNAKKKETLEKLSSLSRDAERVRHNLENYARSFVEVASSLIESFASAGERFFQGDSAYEFKELLEAANQVVKTSSNLLDNELPHIELLSEETLHEWRDSLATFKRLVSAQAMSLAKTIHQYQVNTNDLRKQENKLRNGGKSYQPVLEDIRDELQETLTARHGKVVKVSFYADLMDIKTPLWVNAIEGFLYNQKFNLFVEPIYYLEAYDILKDLLAKNRFYGTTLVDQERIIERRYSYDAGSLAEEIVTDHEGARAYTNFLIGRLKKCRNPQEARNSGNGITPEGDMYRNFAMGRLNPRLYQTAVIGRSVGQKQLVAKQEEIAQSEMYIRTLESIHQIISKANLLEIINSNEINETLRMIEESRNIDGLKKNLDYLEEELSHHDLSQLESYDRRIAEIEEDIADIEQQKRKLLEEKGRFQQRLEEHVNHLIPDTEAKIEARKSDLEKKYDPFFVQESGEPLYRKLVQEGLAAVNIYTQYNVEYSSCQYRSTSLFNNVRKLRSDYVVDYHLSYDVTAEENDAFSHELEDMRDVKLPQYQVAIQDAYDKATKQFKDDFIAKLRTAIDSVETQISELNLALTESVFGNDSYSFTCKPNPLYRRYYDMIHDELILQMGEDETAFIEKYSDVMNDLFRQIVDVGDSGDKASALEANVTKFTDYRSYLEFDLIVKGKDGVEQRLSRMIKKKSGGETQTPFYIAVLASFAQLYRAREKGELGNSLRLIVFDEAFSKMDRGRIKESIRLLRKFGLQAIVSAPSDKVPDISELVDETLVVLHDKNTSCVRLYAEEEKVETSSL